MLWIGSLLPREEDRRLLAAAGVALTRAAGLDAGLASVRAPDVIVMAPGADGGADLPALVRHALAHDAGAWVVALAASREEALAALAAGAHDAIAGDGPEQLSLRLLVWARAAARAREQALARVTAEEHVRVLERAVLGLHEENRRLRDLAYRDELTGLGNRRGFLEQLERAIEFARRYGGSISVLTADLDGMKRLNDACGHPAGDLALRRIAEVFRASVRRADLAARLGGDEFAVVLPATGVPAARVVAERIRVRVESLLLPAGHRMSASFGVAGLEQPRGVGVAADDLLARADAALYAAKRAGKNRTEVDGAGGVRAA